MSNVLVLGAGPSGLVAAHAAELLGNNVAIISKDGQPSRQHGCQYLHQPVPGYALGVPSVLVRYTLNGTPEEYRAKVYGDDWQGRVSPEDFEGEHYAWDIRDTYRRMWDDYKYLVRPLEITAGNLEFIQNLYRPDRIISTIPAPALCGNKAHSFRSHMIYANGSTEHIDKLDNEIICDGTGTTAWYRAADVFGFKTVEWPAHSQALPPSGAVRVNKPLSTDCNCHPHIIRAGRYGEWKKSVLVHQVHKTVMEALS